jgi:hypothetical protein
MKRNHKIVIAVILIVCGVALIGWSFRDPDAGYYEQPKVETVVTVQQVPARVQATIQRLTTAGSTLKEIQEERRGDELKYDVEFVSGNTKTDYKISPDGTIVKQKSKKLKP